MRIKDNGSSQYFSLFLTLDFTSPQRMTFSIMAMFFTAGVTIKDQELHKNNFFFFCYNFSHIFGYHKIHSVSTALPVCPLTTWLSVIPGDSAQLQHGDSVLQGSA